MLMTFLFHLLFIISIATIQKLDGQEILSAILGSCFTIFIIRKATKMIYQMEINTSKFKDDNEVIINKISKIFLVILITLACLFIVPKCWNKFS
jgi:membrane protein CcdC involved in cytochrome C biogenesis